MPPKQAAVSSDEITGQAALPISRIKKIIQLDDDIVQCSQNATFAITIATEMFIRYLAEQGHNVVKSERKPRKLIQYKDLVSRIDNLEFLSDVIPKTTTYKQFKESKAKEGSKNTVMEKGQRTLNGALPAGAKANGDSIDPDETQDDEDATPIRSTGSRPPVLSTLMVDRTVYNSIPGSSDQDVEMTD